MTTDNTQIENALARLFEEEQQRIVFWNDPEREFVHTLPFVYLPEGVHILKLDEVGTFEAKIKIERDDPTGRYLVYSATEEPDYDDDWLLDVRLYSRSFRADRASIVLDQLGLVNQHLREHLAARRKFFDNKDRLKKVQPLVAAADTDTDLDRKMIGVVVKAEQADWFVIIRSLFHEFLAKNNGEDIDLDNPPEVWQQVEKFELDEPFWYMAKSMFGYTEVCPSLKNFLIRLLVTDLAAHIRGELPESVVHLVLPQAGKSNAVVCLAQWRDSSSKGSSYDRLSALVAESLKVPDLLYKQEPEDLLDVMTFLDVEKRIISQLRDRVKATAETINAEEIRDIAARRQDGHWASPNVAGSGDVPRKALHDLYDALVAAADFFALRNQYPQAFQHDDAPAMYHAYETELFRFDQLYRHFCEFADAGKAEGWDIMKKLREPVEACYVNWYLTQLALAWGRCVDPAKDHSLLKTWRLPKVPRQQEFFDRNVKRRLEEAERRRSFVIISDALRYEVAEELTGDLNGKYRFEAELSSQLGVLPSYTSLGMAALLPHKTLTYKANGEILADGKPMASMEQRNQILAPLDGLAVKSNDLLDMKKEEGRKFISGTRLVYIYHNAIDAVGDSASTEAETFAAARRAIDELAAIVSYVFNHLNGNHVIVTADHGFLFTELAPDEADKSSLGDKPAGTVKAKKRYLLGHNLGDSETVWHGSTAATAGAEGDMEFWVPRGANLFHFVGGARFVHGGAMPQEICVPVITVKHRKGDAAKVTTTKKVTVQVLGTSHKITTARHRFEMIQMDAVSDRVKPITMKVAVYEGGGPVTNVETVTFESSSGNLEDRKKTVILELRDREYDKKTKYRLVLRDAETDIEQQSVDVVIDRAFTDDF